MRILTIMGSPNKGNTWAVTQLFLNEFNDGNNEFDEIILPNDMPNICCGCANCILKEEAKCPHFKSVSPIIKKINDADLIMIATPVFAMSCSSGIKALFDHMCYMWLVHRPNETMFKKTGLIITSAAGSGVRSTVKYVKKNMFYWGISKTYRYGVTTMEMHGNYVDYKNQDKIKRQVKRKANKIMKNSNHNKVGLKMKLYFNIFKSMQKQGWNKTDVDYWEDKGWLGKEKPY